MSINLSDLTSPNNQDVLAEITSAADFLDPIGKLENLSRSPNKGGHALQTTALNQPRALPLIDGDGYLYCSGVSGNYATLDSPILPNSSFDVTIDFVWGGLINNSLDRQTLIAQYLSPDSNRFFVSIKQDDSTISLYHGGSYVYSSEIVIVGRNTVRLTYDGATLVLYLNDVQAATKSASGIQQEPTYLGSVNLATERPFKGAIFSVTEGSNTNIDFTATNSPRHGATKFKCATNQIVTINQDSSSSNDVATIIKRPVLRFDGVNDNLKGLLGATVTEGYAFLAFSVLGGGGEQFATCFGLNSTGGATISTDGYAITHRNSERLQSFNSNVALDHQGLFDDANGDILHEVKFTSGSQISKINNADQLSSSATTTISSEEFSIAERVTNGLNTAFDLEYLALFPADSVPDEATATKIRNYINNRNNVFSLVDNSFYFYDAQKAPVGNISSGSSSWNGRIVGSDNGDTDKLATQATANDQPVSDGYVVTFADNSDHLDIPSTSQSGYQIVGSSFGTFVYRINGTTAVTELNLLGNLGASSQRKSGDLYGIILLPESATGKDIQEARKLLIDRGASDAATQNHLYAAWHTRNDIVEFQNIAMPQINQLSYTFSYMPNLVSFPAMSFPVGLYFANAWDLNTSMSDFGAIQAPLGNNFTSAWQGTTALQSFPAGAKLGTAASNVNFTSAWKSSGLTSFPALDLSTGTNFFAAWHDSQLTQFSENAKLGTNASNVNFGEAFITTDLTSFSTPLRNGSSFYKTWLACFSLTDFSYDVLKDWNPDSISNQVFHETWLFCPLTAQSVENILTSIDASNQHGTDDGTSTGNPLGDSGIDIDYNVATGSLSAATNAAVTSLKAKGWSIIVNNVTL